MKAAAPFKTDVDSVRAPERLKQMLQARREWAGSAGLDPEAIAQFYEALIQHFIAAEIEHWETEAKCNKQKEKSKKTAKT